MCKHFKTRKTCTPPAELWAQSGRLRLPCPLHQVHFYSRGPSTATDGCVDMSTDSPSSEGLRYVALFVRRFFGLWLSERVAENICGTGVLWIQHVHHQNHEQHWFMQSLLLWISCHLQHFHLECSNIREGLTHTGPACSLDKLKLSELISALQYWEHRLSQIVFLYIFIMATETLYLLTRPVLFPMVATEYNFLYLFPKKNWITLISTSDGKLVLDHHLGSQSML